MAVRRSAIHHPPIGWRAADLGGAGRALDATAARSALPAVPSTDLFERTAPLYAFMRERLFRDDTDRIARALWPAGGPMPGEWLLELGCGPGVYARRLAARFPELHAVGVDRSAGLLALAGARADAAGLTNCRFQHGDALALDWPGASADTIVASRLFTVVDARAAIGEIYRALRPGGRCFLAEPVSALGTLLPFAALRLAGWIVGAGTAADDGQSGEASQRLASPRRTPALEFSAAIDSRPWATVDQTCADGYLYAVCQKPGGQPV